MGIRIFSFIAVSSLIACSVGCGGSSNTASNMGAGSQIIVNSPSLKMELNGTSAGVAGSISNGLNLIDLAADETIYVDLNIDG